MIKTSNRSRFENRQFKPSKFLNITFLEKFINEKTLFPEKLWPYYRDAKAEGKVKYKAAEHRCRRADLKKGPHRQSADSHK